MATTDLKQPSVLRRSPRVGEEVVIHSGTHLARIHIISLPITGVNGYDPGTDRWQVEIDHTVDQTSIAVMVTEKPWRNDKQPGWFIKEDEKPKPIIDGSALDSVP